MHTSSLSQDVDYQIDRANLATSSRLGSSSHSSSFSETSSSYPMTSITSQQGSSPSARPTFGVACWLFAVIAFCQLLSIGTAIALKRDVDSTQNHVDVTSFRKDVLQERAINEQPIRPRNLKQILADVGPVHLSSSMYGSEDLPRSIRAKSLMTPVVESSIPNIKQDLPYSFRRGVIANPKVEKLVNEAVKLHLEGDIMRAMLKLDEANRIDPNECAVIYQKGLLYEEMGSLVRAADQYQKIQQMGLLKAGEYFKLAANKLMKSMDTAAVRRSSLAIGPTKVNRNVGRLKNRDVEVAVTILARPDIKINPDDVEVQVHFYDKAQNGKIKKASPNANIVHRWLDMPVDWLGAGNEETLRVSYHIPEEDVVERHLLGQRYFYGYVVVLLYKGEVVDQKARPRQLNAVYSRELSRKSGDYFDDSWLPEQDGDLLPKKDASFDEDYLPTR